MGDRMGENNNFYGKKHTEESKAKMRDWHKGKKLTEEHKKKISEYHKNNPLKTQYKEGEKHYKWNGGKQNYWHVQARKVMEKHLCRKIEDKEVVHHIDGNPKNNNIDNLKLFSSHKEHLKYHWGVNPEGRLKSLNKIFVNV